jgi:3-deoxy-7-phosphoheptulonate synthase
MVDCSHANSNKDHNRQPLVARDIAAQIAAGNRSVIGLMLESNIAAGNQPLQPDLSRLQYGVSVTDACIDWETTETLLREIAATVGPVLEERNRVAQSA